MNLIALAAINLRLETLPKRQLTLLTTFYRCLQAMEDQLLAREMKFGVLLPMLEDYLQLDGEDLNTLLGSGYLNWIKEQLGNPSRL
jgi:hypothetical protein